MFKPKFKYNNKIVNLLTKISSARELILHSPLIPKWEVIIRKEAIVRSAHSSTSIEGNRLSLEQVNELALGREVMATRKDKQEVLNYLNVLGKIDKLTDGKVITEKNVLDIHKMLTRGTLENHADFRIHPFIDGNGRTARVLVSLILFLRGFDIKQFFCLDDYYDSNRQAYYKALQSVNQKNLDLTKWLEYFTEGVNVSIDTVKERVVRLSSERLRKSKRGQIALTERQMRIVEFINQNEKITNKNIRDMFKFSDRAALKEIKKLVDLKVIRSEGRGRSLGYILS
ncbi:MAG: Fic family protein [Candidatus Firestonebacteria bacterium]